jgi:hypothetical protein
MSGQGQTVNPGGTLAPAEVVGRDKLVERLWRVLENRSVYMTAERRMGKTSVVRDKMGKEPRPGWRFVYLDVSRAATPLEFVELLVNATKDQLDSGKKARLFLEHVKKRLPNFITEISVFGAKIKLPPELGADWKSLLESLLADLTATRERSILAFDEVPLMLDAIKRGTERDRGAGQGEAVVMEVLDTLRAARQSDSSLRMIYTGSLGLHHVLTGLQTRGYQNDPTNDMTTVEVEPLAPEDATELARRLLVGEMIPCADPEQSARHLATVTDGMPYFVQHLVDGMAGAGTDGDPPTVDRLLTERLTDLRDPWHLRYYDERIDTHYPENLRATARAILDQLAAGTDPLSPPARAFDELTDGIDPAKAARDEDAVRATLRLLGLDSYLTKDPGDGRYRFRYAFIARVWRHLRK